MRKIELPNKPSELLRLALQDLTKCEALPEIFTINMNVYCKPVDGKCFVCLAGAVMVQSLGADLGKSSNAVAFKEKTKLYAIDWLRAGKIANAIAQLGISTDSHPFVSFANPGGMEPSIDCADYTKDPEKFHADMRDLAAYLESFGL